MKASHFSPDTQEFLILLTKYKVKYLIIGGEAVIYYGYARLTGDVDFFYDNSNQNAHNLYGMLEEFWGGNIPEVDSAEELKEDGLILQFGVPPNKIDLYNKIVKVSFNEAWNNKKKEMVLIRNRQYPVYYIGLRELIKNKEALKRNRDLEDLTYLKRLRIAK